MSTTTADVQMLGFPGADAPPIGYAEMKVPPRYLASGDRVLLGGLVRIVRCTGYGTHSGRLILVLEPDATAEANTWRPLTDDLPIPIWRADQAATSPQDQLRLLERVIDGLRALPQQPAAPSAPPGETAADIRVLLQAGGLVGTAATARRYPCGPAWPDTARAAIVAINASPNSSAVLNRCRTAYRRATASVERF